VPGIVGLITKMPRERAEEQLRRMVQSLRHESFYLTGTWSDELLGVYVGWVERKDSFSHGMPLSNERGDVVLVFSGEEFPEPGVRTALGTRGHAVLPDGPSYLVHKYEEELDFPKGLNGRFQGLVADRTRSTAMLFNDRYGMHRIYYYEAKDAFYFAAEAKAILTVCPELRRADPRGLGEFVSLGCVLEDRTLFKNIYVLPPGSAWLFRNGSLETRHSYFEPCEWENQAPLAPEEYYEELRTVFSRNLPRYFNGTEPAGISVTGGLDTRMILAWYKTPPGSLPCYTFGGMFRDCQDVVLGRQVAKLCGQSHEVIPVANDFLSRFPHYAERSVFLTDGCVDVSRSPDLYVNEKAREIAPARVAGIYGSEVLRGVRAFKPRDPTPGLFESEFLSHVCAAQETYAGLFRGHPVSLAVFRPAPQRGVNALEQTQLTVRCPYLDNHLVKLAFRAPARSGVFANNDISLRLIADGDSALRRVRTDRGVAGSSGRLAAVISRGVQEFTFKAEYAYDYGMPQWVARVDHVFSSLRFERLFLGRHKFYHFRTWYRGALSRYVQEMLLDPRTLSRPHLEARKVEGLVGGHLKGNRNYTAEIHSLLTLEIVHRLFLDAR